MSSRENKLQKFLFIFSVYGKYIISLTFCFIIFSSGTKSAHAAFSIVAQDTFQRANQSHWGTASDGLQWQADAKTNNIFSINNTTGLVNNTSGVTYSGLLGPTVTDAQVLVSGYMTTTFKDCNFGAVIRFKDATNFYKAFIGAGGPPNVPDLGEGPFLIIQRNVNGNLLTLGHVNFPAATGTNYSIRFQVIGQTLQAKAWVTGNTEPSAWMVTVTDTTFTTGNVGIRTVDNYGATTRFTSFAAYAGIPDCTTGSSNCGVCIPVLLNTCNTNNGNITCQHTGPTVCNTVNFSQPCTIDACTGNTICSGGSCMSPTYSISGVNFIDINTNGLYDAGVDTLYKNSGQSVSIQGGLINLTVPISNGTYTTGNVLPQGTYTVSYVPPIPSGYFMTDPENGPPPSFSATVGIGCLSTSPDASCSSNTISQLDFGISNIHPWFQSFCGDMRIDSGITDTIPASPVCGSVSGAYAIQTQANYCPVNPGIAFTGNTNASFKQGQSSAKNWLTGGATNPEVFTPVNTNVIRTSYEYLSATIKQSGITPIDLSTICTISSCTLPANLSHGLYQANGDTTLVLPTYTFQANQNYVFLIHGALTLNGEIHVPEGSTVSFFTSGNISVDKDVGNTNPTLIASNLDGFYSTDQSFIINSSTTCSSEKRLNIAGSINVNAGLKGGSFQNQRDLCTQNAHCPTIAFTQRPDLLLHAPDLIKHTPQQWKEVSP